MPKPTGFPIFADDFPSPSFFSHIPSLFVSRVRFQRPPGPTAFQTGRSRLVAQVSEETPGRPVTRPSPKGLAVD